MSYLGLDIGTGGCKAAVFSANGKQLASSFREYPVLHPHRDRAELNPDEVIQKCFSVIVEVNAGIDEPVQAMSISSQGEAFTPVGYDGRILGNAMVSSDSRASDITTIWSNNFGIDKLYRITGHTPHPLFSLYKMLWYKINEPDLWKKTKYLFCFEDLFHFRVGVEPSMSWSLAGRTMLFDVIRHEWNTEILEAAGLSARQLARPVSSGEITGIISLEQGKKLGFKNPVKLVSGGHDQTCAALGAGVIEPGMCMYATGTVECFCPILEKPVFSPTLQQNNLCCYDYTIKGNYTSVAYCLTGGSILRWMRDELGQSEVSQAIISKKDSYSLLLDCLPPQPTDLLVLPYFSATGTPYFDTKAKGAIIGLQHTTTKGEFTKALLEGVALEMKLNLNLMEESGFKIDTFLATGGGSRNSRWNQLKADVLNKRMIVRDVKETGCYGAAALACSAVEKRQVEELIRLNKSGSDVYTPNPENAGFYNQKFEKYKKLYPLLKPLWNN